MISDNGVIYVSTLGNGIYEYTRNTWIQLRGLPTPTFVDSMVAVNGKIYAGINNVQNANKSFFVYSRGKWSPIKDAPPISRVFSLIYSNNTLFAGTFEDGVYAFAKNKWTKLTGAPKYISSMINENGILYAGIDENMPYRDYQYPYGVYEYINDKWVGLKDSPKHISALQYYNGVIYASANTGFGVYKYQNNDWSAVGDWQLVESNTWSQPTPNQNYPVAGSAYELIVADNSIFVHSFMSNEPTDGISKYSLTTTATN
jgi:hypothetical protein